jgi:predicted GNAT family acetyltransferase
MDWAGGDIRWRFPAPVTTIGCMAVQTTTDTGEILGRLEPVLLADPIRNTVFATVRSYLRRVGSGGWCAHSKVALAARSNPGHPIALTDEWTDVAALAEAIGELPEVAGLGGPVPVVEALVDALGRRPGQHITQRLYRLDRLVEPVGVAGRARLADSGDLDLLESWIAPYTIETLGQLPVDFDARRLAATVVEQSRTWLWLDQQERAVSMAACRLPAAGVSRIGPVYTTPRHRGRGYGSAVTARAALDVLDNAAVPVLYADLANPTSNKIYRAMGFRPVADRLSVSFA